MQEETEILDGQNRSVADVPPAPATGFLNDDNTNTPASVFDEVADIAEATKPEIPDQNEPRYGVSLLFDIDISRRNCYNQFGRYGNKLTALPRLVLIPFYSIELDIPAEQPGGVVHGESYGDLIEQFSGAFDYDAYSVTLKTNVMRKQGRSAKACSERFLLDHNNDDGVFGVDVFPELQNLEYRKGANKIFSTVLPVFDTVIFPERKRVVLGYTVEGPFLDAIEAWLKNGAMYAIENSEMSPDFQDRADRVRQRLIALTGETISRAKSRIARKNDLIKRGDVRTYDEPNYRQADAPKPPDLLMLGNTNTPPLQEEEMARAEKYAQGALDRRQIPYQQPYPEAAGVSNADVQSAIKDAIAMATPEIVRQTREAVLAEVGMGQQPEAKKSAGDQNASSSPTALDTALSAGSGE